MHYLFVPFFILTSFAQGANSKEVKEAQASILALISPLIPGAPHKRPPQLKNFRVDKCEKHKIDWGKVMLMQAKAELKFSFKEGCDIEGTIVPKIFQEFPAKLKLRNLENYTSIETLNKITVGLESNPPLFLDMRSGILKGQKGDVKFEANYSVKLDPMKPKSPVVANNGGEIRISEIHGQKVSIKEKIKVQK